MRYVNVANDAVEVGHEYTFWFLPRGSAGQGGVVLSFDDATVALESGTSKVHHDIAWAEVHHVTKEVALDANECIEFGPECKGAVDFRSLTGRGGPPRCDRHWGKRLDRYEDRNSSERYATSDVAPSWFDESAIGERFFEED